jgi:hypothetical protein
MHRPLRGRRTKVARPAKSTVLWVTMVAGVLIGIAIIAAFWAARTPSAQESRPSQGAGVTSQRAQRGAGTAPDLAPTTTQQRPEWLDIPVTDARTKTPLRLADFAGKTVVVESMAIGCVPCYVQQLASKQALAQLSDDQVVYVSLNMLPGTSAAQLRQYADENQFSWIFATDTEQISPALKQHFGIHILNVDAVPMFFISPRGKVSALHTGGIVADDLVRLILAQGDQ